jgi:hypothetical protein
MPRRTLFVLRSDAGSSEAACKVVGAVRDPIFPNACLVLGDTIVTGDDITAARAVHQSGGPNVRTIRAYRDVQSRHAKPVFVRGIPRPATTAVYLRSI